MFRVAVLSKSHRFAVSAGLGGSIILGFFLVFLFISLLIWLFTVLVALLVIAIFIKIIDWANNKIDKIGEPQKPPGENSEKQGWRGGDYRGV